MRSYKTAPRPRCGLNFFYLRLYIQTNQKRTVSSRFSALPNFTTKHNLGAGNLTKIFVTLPFPNKEKHHNGADCFHFLIPKPTQNHGKTTVVGTCPFPDQPQLTNLSVLPRLS